LEKGNAAVFKNIRENILNYTAPQAKKKQRPKHTIGHTSYDGVSEITNRHTSYDGVLELIKLVCPPPPEGE
jgi:hypothetical protein